ncbi:MAG: protease modulator HflC, partial [Lachnospiraceae bacterium]|nr:protease modulator HflC [Lachnospiraceae bacterium]
MKKNKKIILAIIVLILLIGIGNSAFVVHPNETVSILQFSKIIDIKNTTGLYFKVPFVQSTQRVSTKTVLYDIPASDVITKDKKSMTADNYVLWKVTDSKKYIQTLGAISERANERVEAAVYNAT